MLLFYLLITKRKHSKGAYPGIDHHPQIDLVYETNERGLLAMNTVFDTDSDASLNNVTFNSPDFATPEITFSITASPEPASLDDNESIVIPFPDDDNVSAPQLQPVQSYPAQPQPRTIPVEKWTLLIHDSPEECMGCRNAGEGKVTKQRSTGLQLDLPVLDPAQ